MVRMCRYQTKRTPALTSGSRRKEIADGALAVGKPTPSITTLSQRHGHARQTCAKALRMLEDEGLLTRVPGLGYYVTARPATE
jgi:DNA-binding GntR family transcriptional regulator